jgi:hypothetical protein
VNALLAAALFVFARPALAQTPPSVSTAAAVQSIPIAVNTRPVKPAKPAIELSFNLRDERSAGNYFCYELKPSSNPFQPYTCTKDDPRPTARLYESRASGRRIYVVTAGAVRIAPRRLELHLYDAGEGQGLQRYLATAWLLSPKGKPCRAWRDRSLDSLELKSRGCRFDAKEVAQGELVSDALPEREGQRMSGALTFAELPKPVGFFNFTYDVPLRRAKLPAVNAVR